MAFQQIFIILNAILCSPQVGWLEGIMINKNSGSLIAPNPAPANQMTTSTLTVFNRHEDRIPLSIARYNLTQRSPFPIARAYFNDDQGDQPHDLDEDADEYDEPGQCEGDDPYPEDAYHNDGEDHNPDRMLSETPRSPTINGPDPSTQTNARLYLLGQP
ncbi:hypothetical protein IFM61606_01978 [Aspergillus udagawae]|uniref:Uncharacterized protein n=1 Tax=Aspergillus udagawae TaxID=91492 RepID=A0ABQ1A1E0_9EURO|nr:hypothetical protein IFM51744_06206 [Aspergillus udagawae]GFF71247.1 hypothetical protein IFM53868_00513 [Aspergillus udagawae]GFG22123.1 hypothetical protein IFM61606_01978 [Aspergillus udagawae]